MYNNLEQCNRAIDNEFKKYKMKLDVQLYSNKISYDEWFFIQKNLMNKHTLLKMKAIRLFLNGAPTISDFEELKQLI